MNKVPFSRPYIGEEEIAEVVDTLRSGWLTTGPKTRQFEQDFARYLGVPFAVGTSSCTGALQVALSALQVGQGAEVITSTMTFAATAHVIVHAGAKPVFCDVNPATMNLDIEDLKRRITSKTRAIIAVHYAGRPCNLPALQTICEEHGLKLIEDCAHAIGASLAGRACGAWGDAAGFSFYANKNMTTGEGGMFTTSSQALASRARMLRLQGMSRDVFGRANSAESLPSWRYEIVEAGFKHAMSDIHAAIGLHQLKRLEHHQAARSRLALRYLAALADIKGLGLPELPSRETIHAWHLFVVRVDAQANQTRDQLFQALAERGIECSVHFVPQHLQPYYQRVWKYQNGQYPHAEAAFEEILSLPLYPTMTDAEQDRVIESMRALLGSKG